MSVQTPQQPPEDQFAGSGRLGRWSLALGIFGAGSLCLYYYIVLAGLSITVLTLTQSVFLSLIFLLPGLLSMILASIARSRIRRAGKIPPEWDVTGWGLRLGYLTFILGALVAIAVPSFYRARLRATCSHILSGYLRLIDAAKDQYALENSKEGHVRPNWADLTVYLKAGSDTAMDGGNDPLGNPIIIGPISQRLRINPRTKELLKDAADDVFWGPYS